MSSPTNSEATYDARFAQLELLEERVRTCRLCPLERTRTNAVPGEGPLEAEVMFIGEAPGAQEDRQGRPFVGAAGEFLTELIGHAGLDRSDVYICNVLKCRPPGNRDPLPGEVEACDPYLQEQIALIDPLIVVTLGRFSLSKFVHGAAIGRLHGRQRRLPDGRSLLPMYHPAAALHQASLRQTIIEDFQRLGELLVAARDERMTETLEEQEESELEDRQMRLL